MALTFRDYSSDLVEAAHSVLLELVHLLGEYYDDIVVVGGWVPQLILPAKPLKHVGSIDVDLAFNHGNLQEAGYATIQALLLSRGYEQYHRQPFIFHRTVNVRGNPIRVQVDFLAGECEGTGKGHRTQRCMRAQREKPGAATSLSTCSSRPGSAVNCLEAARIGLRCEYRRWSPSW
ncbi:MAG: hypothetical protein ACKV2U_30860 [Bryobacteraceae bacterium]